MEEKIVVKQKATTQREAQPNSENNWNWAFI